MDLLYHYTSIEGFMGIFSKCTKENPEITMRATHSMYLNDPTEYKFGRSICKKLLLEVEDELGISEDARLSNRIYSPKEIRNQESMDYIYSTMPSMMNWGQPYLFSLSKNSDSLPMWTTYAKNGQGLALGFNRFDLQYYNNLKIGECCYNAITDQEYTVRCNRIKDRWRSLYNDWEDIESSKMSDLILDTYQIIFREEFPYIKHCGYNYEREVRCVAIQDKSKDNEDVILYRNSNNLIIPYIERHIKVNCLKRIVVGPCADKEKVRASLIMFLEDKIENLLVMLNDKKFHIDNSDIPYIG